MFTERITLERFIRNEVQESNIELVETHDVRGPLLTGKFGIPLIVRLHGSSSVHTYMRGY